MGEHEGWAQPPSGLLPNGLLPNEAAASVIRVLDSERWLKAEERTAELIACIQPNPPSEQRRNAVADYVQRLITKCFPCQVFTFGSVPLKTYLPDGDIDLTAFSENQNLKETWAHQVRDMLENEEKNENAEFHVKEVQYIQAEVKIIKCLVENIVVDISFNQLGGLCTLCFLEEVDYLINQSHLFKRSIILIKAWCYYESRILGAHHGLISTYALETLVLYIFHVFNNSFKGPLEVLYRFLEFFSKFDWDNFCVSLWGPVPISSLPDVTAEPPRKDGRELSLRKLFAACSSAYAVLPVGQENQVQPFMSKHFNVIDPLRINNNLGRSVSKGNFFRIRSAFAFGAKRLARLLDCPIEDLYFEVNQFFMNTWDRHGSGHRPDAPKNDLSLMRLSNPDHLHGTENPRSSSSNKTSVREARVDTTYGLHNTPSQHGVFSSDSTSKTSEVALLSCSQNQKTNSSSRIADQNRKEIGFNQGTHADTMQRSFKSDNLAGDLQGRYLFARTRSSPELTDTYGEVSSQRCNKVPESGKGQISARLDDSRRKNQESDSLSSPGIRSSTDDPSSVRHTSSHQSLDASADTNSVSNSYHDDSNLGTMGEEYAAVMGTQRMHQEEQDLVNMTASSTEIGFNGQVHVPLNITSGHIPLPIPPSILDSMGYARRNLGGMMPTNIPWETTMQIPQGLVSSPLMHYFPGIGFASNPEDSFDQGTKNFGSGEMNPDEADNDFWHERERGSAGGLDIDNGNFELRQSDDRQQPASASYNYVPSSRIGGSGTSSRVQQKFTKESRRSVREDHLDTSPHEENRGTDPYIDSSRSFPNVHSGPLKSKISSESSWEGSSAKVSKSMREKRGRKTFSSAVQPVVYGRGKSVSEHSSNQADDDDKDWNSLSTTGTEMTERSIGPQSTASLQVPRHQLPGFEPAQTIGSESLIPIGPVLLGPGSRQRTNDNGVIAFYPTGPPVPFVTMLPFNIFPSEAGTSDASTSQFSSEVGLDASDSGQNFDLSEGLDQAETLSAINSIRGATPVDSLEHKLDILRSDFASHLQNLQYGWFCQNPLVYSSPVTGPPVYLQGHVPLDGPWRPVSTNTNLFTEFMSCGHQFVPVASLQSISNRPAGVYQHYMDKIPRNRAGTGTYLPNPKVSVRERHSMNSRKGNYNYDKSDHQGSWNINSKSRTSGRSHSRSQAEKANSRPDRLAANESQADKSWGSHRHDALPLYQSQNGLICSNSTRRGSANMAYGMYPFQSMNPGVSSNGPTIPPVVMLYPYDHNTGYGPPVEQLEFGSFGPVGYSGLNEASHLNEGSRASGVFEDQRFFSGSAQRSSPDQPSSPHPKRGI